MKAHFFLCPGRDHGNRIIKHAYDLYPHKKELVALGDKEGDINVTWGIHKDFNPNTYPIKTIEESNNPHVVIEMGFIHRGHDDNSYYSFGLGGLNGRANFFNRNSPPDRRGQLGIELLPWDFRGDRTMIAGQVTRDASVQHHDHAEWIRESLKKYKNPVFREHPLQGHPIPGINADRCTCSSILKARENHNIQHLVTFNSNVAVEAVINGIPTEYQDEGSMLSQKYGMSSDWREQWLNDIAYAQWKPHEFNVAWERILNGISQC